MEIQLKDENETKLVNELIIDLDISGTMMDLSDSDGCFKMFNGEIVVNNEHSSRIRLRYENYYSMIEDFEQLREASMY